jgi:hypothetical protein
MELTTAKSISLVIIILLLGLTALACVSMLERHTALETFCVDNFGKHVQVEWVGLEVGRCVLFQDNVFKEVNIRFMNNKWFMEEFK